MRGLSGGGGCGGSEDDKEEEEVDAVAKVAETSWSMERETTKALLMLLMTCDTGGRGVGTQTCLRRLLAMEQKAPR